jgi:phosphoglycolate phosphatase
MTAITSETGAVCARSALKVNAVVFDLDGTLIHTAPDLAHAVNRMREDLAMSRLPQSDVMNWIGNGVTRLVKRALTETWDGEPDADLFERGHALFHRHYMDGVCEHSEPYPDVCAALVELKARGFRLACVTNKLQAFTEPLLEELELDGFFESIISGDSLARKKPDPLPLRHICDRFGIAPRDAVLVGDSVNDIKAAKAAGMPVICVSYGYNQGLDLTKFEPNAIIASFKELTDILQTTD